MREGGGGEGSGTAGGRELVQEGLEGSVFSTHCSDWAARVPEAERGQGCWELGLQTSKG